MKLVLRMSALQIFGYCIGIVLVIVVLQISEKQIDEHGLSNKGYKDTVLVNNYADMNIEVNMKSYGHSSISA